MHGARNVRLVKGQFYSFFFKGANITSKADAFEVLAEPSERV